MRQYVGAAKKVGRKNLPVWNMFEASLVKTLISLAPCASVIVIFDCAVIGEFLVQELFPLILIVCAVEHIQDAAIFQRSRADKMHVWFI